MLAPLLRAALDNALRLGDAALTGPVSRGDAGTVAGTWTGWRATAPESVPAYLALARRTADRAIARPAAAADAESLPTARCSGRAWREPTREREREWR